MTLPCIACGKELESAVSDAEYNQPHAGTAFTTHGHYGSTVFDPMTGDIWLELNVCDPCLLEHKDRVLQVESTPRKVKITQKPWDPEDEN